MPIVIAANWPGVSAQHIRRDGEIKTNIQRCVRDADAEAAALTTLESSCTGLP